MKRYGNNPWMRMASGLLALALVLPTASTAVWAAGPTTLYLDSGSIQLTQTGPATGSLVQGNWSEPALDLTGLTLTQADGGVKTGNGFTATLLAGQTFSAALSGVNTSGALTFQAPAAVSILAAAPSGASLTLQGNSTTGAVNSAGNDLTIGGTGSLNTGSLNAGFLQFSQAAVSAESLQLGSAEITGGSLTARTGESKLTGDLNMTGGKLSAPTLTVAGSVTLGGGDLTASSLTAQKLALTAGTLSVTGSLQFQKASTFPGFTASSGTLTGFSSVGSSAAGGNLTGFAQTSGKLELSVMLSLAGQNSVDGILKARSMVLASGATLTAGSSGDLSGVSSLDLSAGSILDLSALEADKLPQSISSPSPATLKLRDAAALAALAGKLNLSPGTSVDVGNQANKVYSVSGPGGVTFTQLSIDGKDYPVTDGKVTLPNSLNGKAVTGVGSDGVTYTATLDTADHSIAFQSPNCACTLSDVALALNPDSVQLSSSVQKKTVTGTVTGGALNAASCPQHKSSGAAAQITVTVAAPDGTNSTPALSGGKFSFDVTKPGGYTVTATAKGSGLQKSATKTVTVTKAADPSCTCTLTAPSVKLDPGSVALSDAKPSQAVKAVISGGAADASSCPVHKGQAPGVSYTAKVKDPAGKETAPAVQNKGFSFTVDQAGTYSITVTASLPGGKVSHTVTAALKATKDSGTSVTLTPPQEVKIGRDIVIKHTGGAAMRSAVESVTLGNRKITGFQVTDRSITIPGKWNSAFGTHSAVVTLKDASKLTLAGDTVQIITNPYIATPKEIPDREFKVGTSLSTIRKDLPTSLKATLDEALPDGTRTITVKTVKTWSCDDFHSSKKGEYTFENTVEIPKKYQDTVYFLERGNRGVHSTQVEALVELVRRTSGGSSGSGSGWVENDHESAREYWNSIADEIDNAEKGDKIYADGYSYDVLYARALRALKGKDVTLVVERPEKDIKINGKKMRTVPHDVIYYTLDEVERLYGQGSQTGSSQDQKPSSSSAVVERPASSSSSWRPSSSAPVGSVSSSSSSSSAPSSSSSSKPETSSSSKDSSEESSGGPVDVSSGPQDGEEDQPTSLEKPKDQSFPLLYVAFAAGAVALVAGIVALVLMRRNEPKE